MAHSHAAPRFAYARRASRPVMVGPVQIGGLVAGRPAPLVLQSMCTTPTQDVEATVRQAVVLAQAGCELVRVTAPGVKDAQALKAIRAGFSAAGFARVPLVADIHFLPAAALEAVEHVEKVRINPGNFADKKQFRSRDYSDAEYQGELARIAERFAPLVRRAKALGRALRIGTNHGSLSDRIVNRFGDTPLGMVESALEFVRIAEAEGFHDLVISMKASNPKVMVQAYRLLAARLDAGGHQAYPLHLGVTEAGDGEDGRTKSAAGIGALLEDGFGDTIRVSLTEPPECELPVARALAARYAGRPPLAAPPACPAEAIDPFAFRRRTSAIATVAGGCRIGGGLVPRVLVPARCRDRGTPAADAEVDDGMLWQGMAHAVPGAERQGALRTPPPTVPHVPLLVLRAGADPGPLPAGTLVLLRLDDADAATAIAASLAAIPASCPVGLAETGVLGEVRAYRLLAALDEARPAEGRHALVLALPFLRDELAIAAVAGCMLIDGLGDAIYLPSAAEPRRTAFTVLQAVKARITRADYVACPSCGRTQFDLFEVTQRIKGLTGHLDGVTIAVMGCIVNGPGEMADADFGYVGSGPGKVDLYRGREVVRRNLAEAEACAGLVELIKEAGRWRDPSAG